MPQFLVILKCYLSPTFMAVPWQHRGSTLYS